MKLVNNEVQEKNCQQNACSYIKIIFKELDSMLVKQLKEFEYSKLLTVEGGG